MIGIWQLVLILVIVMVLFGAGRIPKIMKDLGSGMRAFKKGLDGEGEEKVEDKDNSCGGDHPPQPSCGRH